MNNTDRGMIKWLPFNSIVGQQKIIDELIKEKNKKQKPILSNEQKENLEKKIIEAFYDQVNINVSYYKDGYIYKMNAKINKIDTTFNKIYFSNNKVIMFNQITNINI